MNRSSEFLSGAVHVIWGFLGVVRQLEPPLALALLTTTAVAKFT